MIYPIVLFPVTLSDLSPRFQGHGVIFMPIDAEDALSVFCAQLTRDLLAIAKFLLYLPPMKEEVNAIAGVCLSVCLLARSLKNACMDLDEILRVDRCRDMDELINF